MEAGFGNEDDGEGDEVYSWEQNKKRTWELLEEDEYGRLKSTHQKRRVRRSTRQLDSSIQRGMLRNLIIVMDMSVSMKYLDIKPSRLDTTICFVKDFVKEFLDQNPLCNLGTILAQNSVASILSDLSGVPESHVKKLDALTPEGQFSLQNALLLALNMLKEVPTYMTREVLILQSSLNTSDASDIHATIERTKKENLRCSVVSISSEVYIFKKLTQETTGSYHVSVNKKHFKELIMEHITPLPTLCGTAEAARTYFVHMGFPKRKVDMSFCACHQKFSGHGFFCPRCFTKVCALPNTCTICGLRLVSSSHLARSYHHLFPVNVFESTYPAPSSSSSTIAAVSAATTCFSCTQRISKAENSFKCPSCKNCFCPDCDVFIHESLHNCPGCLA